MAAHRFPGVGTDDGTFYGQWVVANGLAEAAGLGTTFVLGVGAASFLEADQGVAGILTAAILAVLLGIFLEGVVVGVAQGAVLQRRRPDIQLHSWVTATALGAGLAWLIGMIPSTAMALSGPPAGQPSIQEPALVTQLVLAAALGFATGPILGGAQWMVLRRRVSRSAVWLWANALAWALGMPAIFAGMDFVPWNGPPIARAIAIYAVCLVAGLIVGGVHGVLLMRMTRLSPTAAI